MITLSIPVATLGALAISFASWALMEATTARGRS